VGRGSINGAAAFPLFIFWGMSENCEKIFFFVKECKI